MRRALVVLLLALSLALEAKPSLSAPAHPGGLQVFGLSEGLTGQVTALAEDSAGRLWAGTLNGLLTYDQGRFVSPGEGAPGPVAGRQVNALLAAPDGSLWVGLDAGLYRRDPSGSWSGEALSAAAPELTDILALLPEADAEASAEGAAILVAGRDGLARCTPRACQAMSLEGGPLAVRRLAKDDQARLWTAVETQSGSQIWVFDQGRRVGTVDPAAGLPAHLEVEAIQPGAGPQMWVGTDSGLFEFSALSIQHVYTATSGLQTDVVFSLLPHPHDGSLWVGTTRGAQRWQTGQVIDSLTSADGLPGNTVGAMLYDAAGGLWISVEGGLAYSPGLGWERETALAPEISPMRAVLAGPPGEAYVASATQVYRQESGGQWRPLSGSLPGEVFYTLARDRQGQVWAGTSLGLARLAGDTWARDERIPSEAQVTAILTDRPDGMWAGTSQGVYQLQPSGSVLYNKENGALDADGVLGLWQTRSGDVWAGTRNGGASVWRGQGWTTLNRGNTGLGLADDIVLGGLEDSAGNLWFATRNGLSRLRAGASLADATAWRTFMPPEISGAFVRAVWQDTAQAATPRLWVATAGGLNLIQGDHTSSFNSQAGFSTFQVTALSQMPGPDGTLWIGTDTGLIYHRAAQSGPPLRPLQLLTQDGKACEEACRAKGISYRYNTVDLVLEGEGPADLRGLQFEVTLERQQAAAWRTLETLWTAETRLKRKLPEGERYRFTVTAYDRDFNASSAAQPLTVRINNPTLADRLADQPALLVVTIVAIAGAIYWLARLAQRLQLRSYPLDIACAASRAESEIRIHLTARADLTLVERLRRRLARRLEPKPVEATYAVSPDWESVQALENTFRSATGERPLQALGQALYQTLFPAAAGVTSQLAQLGLGSYRARLRLSLCPELRQLPWELLYGNEPPVHLAIQGQVAVVREVIAGNSQPAPAPEKGLPTEEGLPQINRLKVIAVEANPRDLTRLFSQDQSAELFETLARQSPRGRRLEKPVMVEPPTWDRFTQEVQAGCTILQFSGHGGFSSLENAPALYFEDNQRDAVAVPQAELVDLMKTLPDDRRPRLVFLNACRTADAEGTGAQASLAEALVVEGGVAAALGMGYPISDSAARAFSLAFYAALFDNGQVDYAVMEARKRLANKFGVRYGDWPVPRLYCSVPPGRLFRWS